MCAVEGGDFQDTFPPEMFSRFALVHIQGWSGLSDVMLTLVQLLSLDQGKQMMLMCTRLNLAETSKASSP